MLSDLGLASVQALAKALGVSRETIYRNRRLYAEGGVEALRNGPRRPKTPHKLTEPVRLRAQRCLDEGRSVNQTAKEIGLTEGGLRLAIRQGRLQRRFKARVGRPPRGRAPEPEGVSSPSQRAHEDQACEQGVAVKRTLERTLACTGKLAEAVPEFHPTEAVTGAGVLLALPALLEQGLIEVGQEVFGALRNGFFGLRLCDLSIWYDQWRT